MYIRKSLLQILVEEAEEEPKEEEPRRRGRGARRRSQSGPAPGSISIRPGGIGRGNFNQFVKDAKMRAQADPEGLMKDLGVKSASGDDLNQIEQIINAAIHSNATMGEAYTGATQKTEPSESGDEIKVVAVSPSGLDARNGIKFLTHTLSAAKAAGMFNPTGAIVFSKGKNFPIVVYSV